MWILIYTHTLIRQSVNKRKEINNIINTFPDTSKKDKGEKKGRKSVKSDIVIDRKSKKGKCIKQETQIFAVKMGTHSTGK